MTTHPATILGMTITLIANLTFAVIAATEVVRFGFGAEPAPLSAFPAVMFAPIYGFLIIAVYAAGSEYPSGQHRVTLTATPLRGRLATAKWLALAAITIPAAVIVLLPARLIVGLHAGLDPAGDLFDLGRWVIAYFLMSVVAFGLAGLTRNTTTSLTVLILIPILVATGVFQWPQGIKFLPDQAAMSLLGTPAYDVTELPPAIAAIVLAGWALLAVVSYTVVLLRRDT
ncbi:hypothetical protein PCC79_03700 [Propioniciclava soli]|uniref:ABC transporter n=1 Tax=Propioniciclava soli TaxID=2775081 RepID=A0ABZ3CAV5_9ACTN